MKFFWDDLLNRLTSRLALAIWLSLSFLAAVTGPFGTFFMMSAPRRAIYWFTVIGVSIVIATAVRVLAGQLFGHERRTLRDVAGITGNMVVFAPALIVFNHTLFPDTAPPLMDIRKLLIYVAVISIAVTVMRRLHESRSFQDNEAGGVGLSLAEDAPPDAPEKVHFSVPAAPPHLPRLAERLPQGDDLGGIVRLTVADHFVDVIGHTGHERLRMRLADAVKEMEPVHGYCTHRSHWVAAKEIDSVQRIDGKTYLRMSNGDDVPVSRKFRPDLEAAGVL